MILVSAGFDAHWSDPLAFMLLSLRGYARMAQDLCAMAQTLCRGRIVFVLEGGYHLDVLGYSVLNTFRVLLGEGNITDPLGPSPADEEPIGGLIEQLARFNELV